MDGSVVLNDGLRLSSTWDHSTLAASRLARGAERQADWFRPPPQLVDGYHAELWLNFRSRLRELRIRLCPRSAAHVDDTTVRARDIRHWTWLVESLGAPSYGSGGGVVYGYGWGWVHAGRGSVYVTYPQVRTRVPLPGRSGPHADFRCMRCAAIESLPYGAAIEVSRARGGAPCDRCGDVAWVRVGSDSESVRMRARPDYCEVGRHMAQGVRTHRLIPKRDGEAPHSQGSMSVRACEEHRSLLHSGFYGFVLPREGESAG
ncbi:MAG: hypothetical protein R3B09_21860 [Nannocystaceae bacterium]